MRLNASQTDYPVPTKDTPLKGRICACGCEETFDATKWWQRFKSDNHRKAAFLNRWRSTTILADHEKRLRVIEAKLEIKEK